MPSAAIVRGAKSVAAASPMAFLTLQRSPGCACGGGCPSCQAKQASSAAPAAIAIGPANDMFEREAERASETINATPAGDVGSHTMMLSRAPALSTVQRCGCGGSAPAGGTCAACAAGHQDDEEKVVQRAPDAGAAPAPAAAPPSVHATLASSGRALDAPVRSHMEAHFGADFGGVQVHTDPSAAASAGDVDARAYTVGPHVVFAPGEYSPTTNEGRKLLAHELAHVVQQGAAPRSGPGASLQRTPSPRMQRAPKPPLIRFPVLCNDLLNAPEQLLPNGRYIDGRRVHKAIGDSFKAELGTPANSIGPIPEGFWQQAALGCGEPGTTQNAPRPTGRRRSGDGPVDLVYRRGNVGEIAEIKPATATCIPEAQAQVKHYVEKGNEDANKDWRQGKGIDHFERMPVGRSTIRQVDVEGTVVTLSWCEPGVLVYKPLLTEGEGNVTCGIKDEDLDAAVRKLEDPAQAEANRMISEKLDKALDHIIKDLTLRDGINKLWKAGRRQILAKIAAAADPMTAQLLSQLDDEKAVDMIATWIDKTLDHNASELLRSIAHGLKDEIINKVRGVVQAETKAALKEAILAACVGALAGVVRLSDVIAKYLESLYRRLPQIVTDVAVVWAMQAARELATAVAHAMLPVLAVVAVAAFIFFLPEILGSAVVVGAVEAIGAIVTAVGTFVAAE
ncbi:MAG TPA: DUF4157 domain-containing protein, partial [Gemmatimonadaceae bacterium]